MLLPIRSRSLAVGSIRTTTAPRSADARRLRAQPPAGGLAQRQHEPLADRARRWQLRRAGRVDADHEIETRVRQHVEVRPRAQAAVHVAAAVDLDRPVEAGDRARRGHGVGQVGPRGRRGGRTRRAARWRSRSPPPPVRGAEPSRRGSRGGSWPAAARSTACRAEPARHDRGRRVPVVPREHAEREPPGTRPERGAPAVEAVLGGGPVPVGGHRLPVRVDEAHGGVAGGMGDHQPGRRAAGEQRGRHRSGRGPDDPVGAAGVPARLGRDRVERADEPRAAQHPAGSENEAGPRRLRRMFLHLTTSDPRRASCQSPERLNRALVRSG